MPDRDERNPARRLSDAQIAAEPSLPAPDLADDAVAEPVEAHLARHARRPLAVAGVVENGLVRPIDPSVKLREHARVIIVAPDGA